MPNTQLLSEPRLPSAVLTLPSKLAPSPYFRKSVIQKREAEEICTDWQNCDAATLAE
jgi:hypothetical protein